MVDNVDGPPETGHNHTSSNTDSNDLAPVTPAPPGEPGDVQSPEQPQEAVPTKPLVDAHSTTEQAAPNPDSVATDMDTTQNERQTPRPPSEPQGALQPEQSQENATPKTSKPASKALMDAIVALGANMEKFEVGLKNERAATKKREETIDKLHADLRQARSGTDLQLAMPVYRAVTRVLDDMSIDLERIRATRDVGGVERDPLKLLTEYRDALLIALSQAGLEQESEAELMDLVGSKHEARRMQAVGIVPTADQTLHSQVIEVVSPGYHYDDVLVIPTRVRVYKYQETGQTDNQTEETP
ncbi:MAG: hypothetical protein AAF420_01655 [Pseudomonadota bacterium]